MLAQEKMQQNIAPVLTNPINLIFKGKYRGVNTKKLIKKDFFNFLICIMLTLAQINFSSDLKMVVGSLQALPFSSRHNHRGISEIFLSKIHYIYKTPKV